MWNQATFTSRWISFSEIYSARLNTIWNATNWTCCRYYGDFSLTVPAVVIVIVCSISAVILYFMWNCLICLLNFLSFRQKTKITQLLKMTCGAPHHDAIQWNDYSSCNLRSIMRFDYTSICAGFPNENNYLIKHSKFGNLHDVFFHIETFFSLLLDFQ